MEEKDLRVMKDDYIIETKGDLISHWLTQKLFEQRDCVTIYGGDNFYLVDNLDIEKKLFLVYDGVLRQFKIKKQIFFPFNYNYKSNKSIVRSALLIEICGIGEMWIRGKNYAYSHGQLPCDCFESVEDFKGMNPYEISYHKCSADEVAKMYNNIGVATFKKTYATYIASIWKWDGVRAVEQSLKGGIVLCFAWDGKELDMRNDRIEKPYYATKKECEEDNSIKVEYFADDDEEEEPKKTLKDGITSMVDDGEFGDLLYHYDGLCDAICAWVKAHSELTWDGKRLIY